MHSTAWRFAFKIDLLGRSHCTLGDVGAAGTVAKRTFVQIPRERKIPVT